MKKLLYTAIILLLSACSKETNITVESPQTIHVTVGAGISDQEPQTRSLVEKSGTTRTLKFTAGDRLYVRGVLERNEDMTQKLQETKIVAGYLTIDASGIYPGGTRAIFTGDLDVLAGEIVPTDYDEVDNGQGGSFAIPCGYGITSYNKGSFTFSNPSNPLADCLSINAVLVHKDAGERFAVDAQYNWSYQGNLAANAEELMTTFLTVQGTYNGSEFTLATGDTTPILNCSISGLTAGATYDVYYLFGATTCYDSNMSLSPVTADTNGKATLAFFGKTIANGYHAIRFVNQANDSEWKLANIAQKTLGNKVYSVSRTVIDDPDLLTPVITWISVQDSQSTTPDEYNRYWVRGPLNNGYNGPSEFAVSGNFEGCYFVTQRGATIHLSHLTGTYDGNDEFFYSFGGDLILDLKGTNRISSRNRMQAICVDNGTLKFKGNGTLTLTANDSGRCGIWISNGSGYSAVDGYTVSRSAGTDNHDGTYSWTYTVQPAQ